MKRVPLKHLANLSVEHTRSVPAPLLSLDAVEGGTGEVIGDVWSESCEPPSTGVADVEPGDVLFGKLRPYLAKVTLAPQSGYASTELLCLRPKAGVEPRWLAYRMLSRPVVNWAVATSEGTKMPRTSWDRLSGLPVPVPSASRQRAIANFLDAETARIDALINRKRELVRLSYARHRAHVSHLTAAHLSASLNDGAADWPEGWRAMRLQRCLSEIDYGIGEASSPTGAVAVLGMGNVDDHGHVESEPAGYVELVDPRLLLRIGDLLFNRTNSLAKVGKLGIVRHLYQPTTFASYLVRLRVTADVFPGYLNYILNTDELLGLARSTALPSIGQANLNPSRYSDLRVALPSVEEQRFIITELDDERDRVEAVATRLDSQVNLLQERRQALITAAVTGELDLAEAG